MSGGMLVGQLPNTATQDEVMTLAVSNLTSVVTEDPNDFQENAS